MQSQRAKVFISCGQKTQTNEIEAVNEIKTVVEELGFEPYVAVQQQSLLSLRENIFDQLAHSEYFLFVDFIREQLDGTAENRGSLFSHQELAIASYLYLPIIAFQQSGVKQLDGMMKAFQVNAIPFTDINQVPMLVREEIGKAGWRADWKNALAISRQRGEHDDTYVGKDSTMLARFFHLDVTNRNLVKPAFNCIAYVESILDMTSALPIPLRTAELKWAGYTFPYASILARSHRQLDACFVMHDDPQVLYFNCFSDSGHFWRPMMGPGKFEITYLVTSETFPMARLTVTACVGNSIDDAGLT